MLNRFLSSKMDKEGGGRATKRPYLASNCKDLNEADKWRSEILRDIGRKVMEIQNAGLGEHRLRDLNDEINKLIREKGHWERRIVELGGPNYARSAPRVTDGEDGSVPPSGGRGGGYRYFGAAKQLPGVKELFDKPPPRTVRRTRQQMYQSIDAEYYGFRDEEDGTLMRVEAEAERRLIAEAEAHWQQEQQERTQHAATVGGGASHAVQHAATAQFVAHVPGLPDQDTLEQLVVAKKKLDLMVRYLSADQQAAEAQSRSLLGR